MDLRDVTWMGVWLALCMLAFGAACGSDEIDDNDWHIDEQNEAQQGCTSDGDCPEDMWCAGPPQCGAEWSCQEDYPCSAAPPSMGCSCDGRVVSLSAGCTQRHAWDQHSMPSFVTSADTGDPCDAEAELPITVSLSVSVSGFDQDLVGEQVKARFTSETLDAQVGVLEATVDTGGTIDAQATFEADDSGDHSFYRLSIWWDADDDGACGDGDHLWRATRQSTDVDLVTFEATGTYETHDADPETGCSHWE